MRVYTPGLREIVLDVFFYGSSVEFCYLGDFFEGSVFAVQGGAVLGQELLSIERALFDRFGEREILLCGCADGVALVVVLDDDSADALC